MSMGEFRGLRHCRGLLNGRCQCGGSIAARRGEVASRNLGCRQVLFVDADVEAGLLKLLFDIDFTLLNERQELASQPGDLRERKSMFGDINGLPGEMG
jgi:hypothetical protein